MGANPLHDPTLAEKARQALEAEGVDTGAIKSNDAEDKKSAFQAKLLIDFVAAKPRLSDVLTDCKQMLGHMPTMGLDEAMQKAEEENIKKIISDLVKEVGLVHRDTKLDDNYNVVKANNYRAVNRILRCLKQNETVEQVLQCVYTHVYALLAAQAEEPAPQPNDNEDRFGSTEAFLSWQAVVPQTKAVAAPAPTPPAPVPTPEPRVTRVPPGLITARELAASLKITVVDVLAFAGLTEGDGSTMVSSSAVMAAIAASKAEPPKADKNPKAVVYDWKAGEAEFERSDPAWRPKVESTGDELLDNIAANQALVDEWLSESP